MFCGECGAQNPDTNQFCRNCGKPLARRQPVSPPVSQPVPVQVIYPAPVTAVPAPMPLAAGLPVRATAAIPKHSRNWLGMVSLILGFLSWGLMTFVLAIVAIILGIAGTILFRKSSGRIGISGIIGIILAFAAIAVTIMLA
jgi:hypothetical protein